MKKIYTVFGITALLFFNMPLTQATTHTVSVSNNIFNPAAFTAQIGDTVTWTWVSGAHTTTSTSVPLGAVSWDQPINSLATSYSYHIFIAGVYNYVCTFHQSMGMVAQFTAINPTGVTSFVSVPSLAIIINPVQTEFKLSYYLNEPSPVTVTIYNIIGTIYNIIGKIMSNYYFGILPAGVNERIFNISNFPKGLYLIKVNTGEFNLVRKIIIE